MPRHVRGVACALLGVLLLATAASTPAVTTAAAAVRAAEVRGVESDATVTLGSLLAELIDPMRPVRARDGEFTAWLETSRNPAASDPANRAAWFANDDRDHFARIEERNGRREWVLCDVEGPGAVVRLWTAMEEAHASTRLRIYLDGESEPRIEANFHDLLVGRSNFAFPIAMATAPGDPLRMPGRAAGALSLMPIPFAKRFIATLDRAPGYWQITGRRYPVGTNVESMPRDFAVRDRAAIERAAAAILAPTAAPPAISSLPAPVAGIGAIAPPDGSFAHLPPGAALSLERVGPDVIEQLTVVVEDFGPARDGGSRDQTGEAAVEARVRLLRGLWLECAFDGEQCVRVPVGHFFGLGDCMPPVADRMRSARVLADGSLVLVSRFAMPCLERASIAIRNTGPSEAKVRIECASRALESSDPSEPRLFHATFREDLAVPCQETIDWPVVRLEGSGEVVGTTLAITNPHAFWHGEGDEKIQVDSDPLQRQLGTGTEDLIGCAWGYPRALSSDAVSVAPRTSDDRKTFEGRTTASRLRYLDGIPFTRSLAFDLEWVPPARFDRPAGLAATTFWYARAGGAKASVDSVASATETTAANPLPGSLRRLEGWVEAEDAAVVGLAEGLAFEVQAIGLIFPDEDWSGGRSLFLIFRRPGDWIRLEIPCSGVADGSEVRLLVRCAGAPDYGVVRFSVQGRAAGEAVSLRRDRVMALEPIDLGVHRVSSGKIVVEITADDTSELTGGRLAGIDCFKADAVVAAPEVVRPQE